MLNHLRATMRDEAPWRAAGADYSNLDLIRALAVLCVVFHHLCNALGAGTDLTWLVGHMGVLIFFVHTSLVLMMSLERSVVKLPAHLLVADFYIRRIFRIYPLAMLCVTVAFIELVPSRAEPWPWPTFLSNLALTMNLTYSTPMWSVLWTLPLEVQMYLVLPIIFLLLRGRSLWWAAAGWGVTVLAALSYTRISSRLDVAVYAPCFFAGIIAWRLMRPVQPRWSGAWWPLAFVASWGVFLIAPRSDPAVLQVGVRPDSGLPDPALQQPHVLTGRARLAHRRAIQLRDLPLAPAHHSLRSYVRRLATVAVAARPWHARPGRDVSPD